MRTTIGVALVACSLLNISVAEDTPQVEVSNVRRVFDNGEHNAFTDLIQFRDRYYLTFRSCPDGHMVHPTASVIIMVSDDLRTWKQVHQFRVAKRDTRDPHFLAFNDRLFVYTGTWYSGETTLPRSDYDLNKHLGYAAWSDDGVKWHSPIMLEGTFGHYIWRATTFDGKAYLCGRRKHQFDVRPRGEGPAVESAMLKVTTDWFGERGHCSRNPVATRPRFCFSRAATFWPSGVGAVTRLKSFAPDRPTRRGIAVTLIATLADRC